MSGQYRLELASSSRAGCQATECKKAGTKIQKGELRMGVFVTIKDYQTWKWKHWGCVTPKVIDNVKDATDGNMDYLDGFDELPEDEQDRIREALNEGHVADEDWKWDVEMNRPGMNGFLMPASKKKKKENTEADQAKAGEHETPTKPKTKKRGRGRGGENPQASDVEAPQPKKAKAAPKKGKKAKQGNDEDEVAPVAPKDGARKKASKMKSEDPDDDVEVPSKAKGRQRGSRVMAHANEDNAIKQEDSDSDAPLPARSTKKSRAPRQAAPKNMKLEESEVEDQINGHEDSDAAKDDAHKDESALESAPDSPEPKKGRKKATKVVKGSKGKTTSKAKDTGLSGGTAAKKPAARNGKKSGKGNAAKD